LKRYRRARNHCARKSPPVRGAWIETGPRPTAPPNTNLLSGLITSRTFLGAAVRLSVLVGEFYLNVDVPTRQAETFTAGQLVQLSFPPDQCRVLTVEAAPTSVKRVTPLNVEDPVRD